MLIMHFASNGSLTSRSGDGYAMQYSNGVYYVFAYVDGLVPSSATASLVCTPNGSASPVTLLLSQATQTVNGETVSGYGIYLPASVMQIAGPLSLNLFVTKTDQTVLVTYTTSVYVNAVGSATEWSTPITDAQWQEIVAYLVASTNYNLGQISSEGTLDGYQTPGLYYYNFGGDPYTLQIYVDGSGNTNQMKTDCLTGTTYNRTYSNSAWGAWDALGGTVDLSGYVPTSRTVNGHALTSDVTVTKADILGAYGGTQVTDLNSIALSGFYTCYGTAAGAPKESSSWFVIHTNSNAGTSYAEQTAISFADGTTFKRYKLSASVWSDWDRQMAVSDFCSSYNLYDYTRSLTNNVSLDAATGAEVPSTGNFCSSFIRIKPSTSYLICVAAGRSHPSGICFYDSSKAFLSSSATPVLVSPPNASFVRFSGPISEVSSSMVVETANSYVPYFIPFRNHIMASAISDDLSENIVDSSLKTSKLSLAFSKNMFDKESAISGYFVSPSLGVLVPGSSYSTSAYIPVKENSYYSGIQSPWILNMRFVSCFTKTKEVIGEGFTNVATFLTPPGCAFVRVSVVTYALATTQLIRGSTVPSAIDYTPYNLGIPKSSIIDDSPDSSSLHIFLPSEICVAVGRTIEIYDSQVVLENDKYHLNWTCAIGKNLKRKFSVTGTTALIGEYSLVLSVYDDSLNLVVSKTATLKIVAAETNPVSVLPLGDSITNGKYWLDETRSLSGDLVTFVGTLGTAPLNHEGRSGWTASQYVSSASVSGVTNPFYDPSISHFSWSYYKTQTGKNPNAVLINLGTNGLSLDPSSAVASFKQLVDYIRTDDSSIPIYVSFIHFWGNQNGIGIQQSVDGFASQPGNMKFSQDVKVLLYNKALFDALSSYSNLHFVPIGECHDSENNFGDVSTLVNPRASADQVESMPVEGVHPQQQGYEQFADVIFSVLSKYVG